MDAAAKWTDGELARLERSIQKEYTKAYQECRGEMNKILARVSSHQEWDGARRFQEMEKYNRLNTLSEQMADTIEHSNENAVKFIKNDMVNIYKTNYNWQADKFSFPLLDNTAVKNILTGQANPFTKLSYEALKDGAASERALKSELMTGLLKGESIDKIARRIRNNVVERYKNECVRIARTETTYTQNSARQSVGEYGKTHGFKMLKEWVATEDGKTRDAHMEADGQRVPIDEPFHVGGEELMFPGDYSLGASAWNIISCRCIMVTIIDEG